MWVVESHYSDSEWTVNNIKARQILKKFMVEFDKGATCTGVPVIHFHDMVNAPDESDEVKQERFRARIRLLGSGSKINSGLHGVFPHDLVRLTLVRWGEESEQIGYIEVGEGTELNGTTIVSHASVKIGRNVLLGPGVVIMDSDGHPLNNWMSTAPPLMKPVVVNDGAWLGFQSVILKGVTIGAGAVVGARSVVTRDVPPRSVVAGNPASVIRELND